ncbi:MAG: hypothetical protein U0992_15160 [Planctomycetaceae bacterium]
MAIRDDVKRLNVFATHTGSASGHLAGENIKGATGIEAQKIVTEVLRRHRLEFRLAIEPVGLGDFECPIDAWDRLVMLLPSKCQDVAKCHGTSGFLPVNERQMKIASLKVDRHVVGIDCIHSEVASLVLHLDLLVHAGGNEKWQLVGHVRIINDPCAGKSLSNLAAALRQYVTQHDDQLVGAVRQFRQQQVADLIVG